MTSAQPIVWKTEVPALILLDQRALPFSVHHVTCSTYEQVALAISNMVVRGAPAISIAGAYGLVLASRQGVDLEEAYHVLCKARPTARNLVWALDRVRSRPVGEWEQEAGRIFEEDVSINRAIGDNLSSALVVGVSSEERLPLNVYHHCNTGSLATAGYGTALGVVRSLHREGDLGVCWVGETRPYLQGARLTVWELAQDGIPHMLVVDSAAGHLMSSGDVDIVLVGCDRVALDGGVANKIGTYSLAVLAKHNGIPFYVCCPWSTYDPNTEDCWDIPIEHRPDEEVRGACGLSWVSDSTPVYNPSFDITPPSLITGWVTETGVYYTAQDLHEAWRDKDKLKNDFEL